MGFGQGGLFFDEAQDIEDALTIPCKYSPGFSEIHVFVQSTDGDCGVPHGRKYVRTFFAFRLMQVFSERDIARVMNLVFNPPMAAIEIQ